jgi:hypothetical protein
MNSETEVQFDARQALQISENAQAKNVKDAIGAIRSRANMGFQEAILFNENLNLEGMKKLMDLGFSVITFTDPMQITLIKVSW